MDVHSARYSSHHDCPFISSELSVGQMAKKANKMEHWEHWEHWTQATTPASPLKKGFFFIDKLIVMRMWFNINLYQLQDVPWFNGKVIHFFPTERSTDADFEMRKIVWRLSNCTGMLHSKYRYDIKTYFYEC